MESKLLVKIKGGNYSLWDIGAKQNILPARPYVVVKSTFIMNKIAEDVLESIAVLKAGATDEIFVKYIRQNKGDRVKGMKEFLKYYDENSKEKVAEEAAAEAAKKKAAEEAEAAKKKAAEEAEAAKKSDNIQNMFA